MRHFCAHIQIIEKLFFSDRDSDLVKHPAHPQKETNLTKDE